MAATSGEADRSIIRAERLLVAIICIGFAAVEAYQGLMHAPIAGFLGAGALLIVTPAAGRSNRLLDFLVDFLFVSIFALLCDPAGVLWRAPHNWSEVFSLTPVGASTATLLYLFGALALRGGARLPIRLALFIMPFMFCLLLTLGAPPVVDLGGAVLLGIDAPETLKTLVGRCFVLFLLNEVVVVGTPLALGRFLPREWRPHGVLLLAALGAALTPIIASSVSSVTPYAPAPFATVFAALAAALAQAGLWGETYLVTQSLAGLLGGTPSLSVIVYNDWKSGAQKGAVYGFVFITLLLLVQLVVSIPGAVFLIAAGGPITGALIGALTFPLLRTIVESTDSTPPFFNRLRSEYERPTNFIRGLVAGAAVGLALTIDLPASSSPDRFMFGVVAGALAYAGVDAAIDLNALYNGKRQHLRSWRVYALGAMLGGIVAGAIAWYLDAGQIAVVLNKFSAYVSLDYKADGRNLDAYVIRPLFSKWGGTELGVVDGGVRLLYDESLSGVIQWVFAAPLFSINLFFLTALIQRSVKPLRQLASMEGLDLLVENAVRVLRWGLWMAPVIYSFLKASPDPTWYNQDGLIRTAVATWLSNTLPNDQFRAWSLDIFTALLAFDALRILIWFDHMGLRVATLVNLSFVGGDIADEKAARFIGKSQVSRAIPEGLRRFATWAPLLLPFYIPRGAEWDKAWSAAEQMTTLRPPAYTYLVSGYLAYAGILAAALVVYLLVQLARAGRLTLEGVTGLGGAPGSRPLRLTNGLMTSEWFEDSQGANSRRRRAARRPADRSDATAGRPCPSARALPVFARGRWRTLVARSSAHLLRDEIFETRDEGSERAVFSHRAQWRRSRSECDIGRQRRGRDHAAAAGQSRRPATSADARVAPRMGAERNRRRTA